MIQAFQAAVPVRPRLHAVGVPAREGENLVAAVVGEAGVGRDVRDTAVEAARFLQQRLPGAKIVITDVRDGSQIQFTA